MRKEIIGILLFFLVVFTLVSFLSYSPSDPSVHNATAGRTVHNLFGVVGAHTAGIFIGLFGLGAFWVPVLLLLVSLQFFGGHSKAAVLATAAGGILLIITTGSLFSLATHPDSHLVVFGTRFSTGGLAGISLKTILVRYTSLTGSTIILVLIWVVAETMYKR